jgi:hypothetical protein
MPVFLERWNTPERLLAATTDEIEHEVTQLGFGKRRSKNLRLMAERFLEGDWESADELPGCGAYARACHDMFCRGIFSKDPPNDHAAVKYWRWFKKTFPDYE